MGSSFEQTSAWTPRSMKTEPTGLPALVRGLCGCESRCQGTFDETQRVVDSRFAGCRGEFQHVHVGRAAAGVADEDHIVFLHR
jgi:hypothetical protein